MEKKIDVYKAQTETLEKSMKALQIKYDNLEKSSTADKPQSSNHASQEKIRKLTDERNKAISTSETHVARIAELEEIIHAKNLEIKQVSNERDGLVKHGHAADASNHDDSNALFIENKDLKNHGMNLIYMHPLH
jgi:phage shock protein A